jgi:hypothetical protein
MLPLHQSSITLHFVLVPQNECLVGTERLELSHLAALEPKSSASTNFATSPMAVYIIEIVLL